MAQKKKVKVITISKVFPKYHPKAGELTNFRNQILFPDPLFSFRKIHTIRGLSDWHHVAYDINAGEKILSLRQWSGIPRRSKQEKPFLELEKIEIQFIKIIRDSSGYHCTVRDKLIGDEREVDIETIATNDGLWVEDFKSWFEPNLKYNDWTGVIIHFTDFRY